ncbi:MAG: hypothetical protein EOO14_24890 [Chitinophagaceae bacterium]|nr:MAG: hypothetical protein EOO14_24890 [Chitinophagaceae bacterium]
MKRLLYLTFCFATSFWAEAQILSSEVKKYQQDPAYRHSVIEKLNALKKKSDTSIVTPTLPLYLQNPKPGTHRLPQDGMPCIVPDMNATVAIPNTWRGEKKIPFSGAQPGIPNPAKPFRFAPSRPLLTYPDTYKTK